MFKAIVAFALGFILILCGCSRQKILTKDELRSELTSAKSLARETEMFLDLVRQNRVTKYYAQGHIEYLIEVIERSKEELEESSPAQGEEDAAQELKVHFYQLNTELRSIRGRLDEQAAVAAAKEHFAQIRHALDGADPSI